MRFQNAELHPPLSPLLHRAANVLTGLPLTYLASSAGEPGEVGEARGGSAAPELGGNLSQPVHTCRSTYRMWVKMRSGRVPFTHYLGSFAHARHYLRALERPWMHLCIVRIPTLIALGMLAVPRTQFEVCKSTRDGDLKGFKCSDFTLHR